MKEYMKCLAYRNYTYDNNPRVVKNKQRLMLTSNCSVCEGKKNMFVSKGSGLLDSLGLNIPQNRMNNALWNDFG